MRETQQVNQSIELVVRDKDGNLKEHKKVTLKNGVKKEETMEVLK